jgi:hypothetical protein
MAQAMRLMGSFSQRERFIWRDNTLTVIIPNGTRTAYHPRASQSYLKALLIPQLRLTRAGNVSSHQPTPPPPQTYDFYLAQLIHYGLDFHFEIETAQRALEIEIRLDRLRVPPGLVSLEKELRKAHEREQKKVHEDAVRYAAKQKIGETVDAAISVETYEDESRDERKRSARPKSAKRKRQDVADSSDESESASGFEGDSGEESGTIAVAPDNHDSTSSDGSSSSSEEDVPKVKRSRSVSSEHRSINSQSLDEADDEENSRDGDPFLDRRDVKRVKLEKSEEQKDSILRSTRETAPFVGRKQFPPQIKVRRIASQPQINFQPINSAKKETVGNHSASTNSASGKIPPRKPFVNPDRRPSWTIPVRSPSSAQKDTPKSVTFSQVQRETPTKVPVAEKATFSSAMKTPQSSPRERTVSFSSDHSYTTPLRSILKKPATHPDHNHMGSDGRRSEISIHVPRGPETTSSSSRTRRRKRKSGENPALDRKIQLGGVQDSRDMRDDSYSEKPHITSDIVNSKPISMLELNKCTSNQLSQASPSSYQDKDTAPGSLRSSRGFVAVNSKAWQ